MLLEPSEKTTGLAIFNSTGPPTAMTRRFQAELLAGVDEVGRGPLAGPLAVGVFCCDKNLLRKYFYGVKDSKQLRPDEREVWFEKILGFQKTGEVDFSVTFVSAITIDRIGISASLKKAIASGLKKLQLKSPDGLILLDGGIKAPPEFVNQKTIIKGDEKEPIIALASIVAKVRRDRLMTKIARKYSGYGFEKHKGYGTAAHFKAIHRLGLSPIHRRSFLKKLATFN